MQLCAIAVFLVTANRPNVFLEILYSFGILYNKSIIITVFLSKISKYPISAAQNSTMVLALEVRQSEIDSMSCFNSFFISVQSCKYCCHEILQSKWFMSSIGLSWRQMGQMFSWKFSILSGNNINVKICRYLIE